MQYRKNPYLYRSMKEAIDGKGHNSIMVYGRRGSGKSTFAMFNGRPFVKSWSEILKSHLFFKREQLIEKLSQCYDFSHNPPKVIYRYPFLIWDDAGVENMKSKEFDVFLEELPRFLQTIRSVVSNFIWTLTNPSILKKKYLDGDWTVVRTHKDKRNKARFHADYYKFICYPDGNKRVHRITSGGEGKITDNFRYDDMPQDFRGKYELIRDGFSGYGFHALVKAHERQRMRNMKADFDDSKFKEMVSKAVKTYINNK